MTCYSRLLVRGKLSTEANTTKEKEIMQKKQEDGNEIKRKLTVENKESCDWKFQIYWNKLEWVNPRSRDEIKNPFCVSSKKFVLKITKKTCTLGRSLKTKIPINRQVL